MLTSKTLLKYIIALVVWSIIVIVIVRNYFDSTFIFSTVRIRMFSNDVLIDHRQVDDEALVLDVQFRIPSLPISYWNKTKNNGNRKSKNCAKYPNIYDLEFSNIYWQTLRSSNGTFQLFGAYYDIRKISPIGPAVRILGMIDRIEPTVKTYCQFWFDDKKEPIIVETFEYTFIWNKKWGNYRQGIYQPYLISCRIPIAQHGIVPATVSIVEKECDEATNNLRVIYNPAPEEKRKSFAVCVKGLDFLYDDMSVRLIEWMEMIKILGAEKVYVYDLHMHPNMTKVLKYYEQEGFVQVTPLTLAGGYPNAPGVQHLFLYKRIARARQTEIIPYNDCLYKNMYLYDFIALLDIDEVIMPKNDMTWGELMKRELAKSRLIKNGTYHSYNVRNVFFLAEQQHDHGLFNDIPNYLLMLQHVHRAKNYTAPRASIKCFHNTERVLSLHNHFPMLCLDGWCSTYSIDTEDAQMHHYCALNKKCQQFHKDCIEDTTIWKYKDELVRRSVKTLDRLGFFGPKETNG